MALRIPRRRGVFSEWGTVSLRAADDRSGAQFSDAGADACACLRGYLATMRQQGQALLATLETVFTVQPLSRRATIRHGSRPIGKLATP
jgi:hypothetical protein